MMACSFSAKAGSLDSLKARKRWGARPCALQIFCTVATPSPTALAIGSRGPVRSLVRRRLKPQPHQVGDPRTRHRRLAGRARLVREQPFDAGFRETLLPAPHRRLGFACRGHDAVGAHAGAGEKDDTGAPGILLRRVAIRNDGFKALTIGG